MNIIINKKSNNFDSVALKHFDALLNTAIKLTWNREDAEDLVQDAFLKAYKFYDKYEPGTNFKAWIYKILINTFINKYNKNMKYPKSVPLDDVEHSIKGTLISEEKDIFVVNEIDIKQLFNDRIFEAVKKMPEDIRKSVLLCDIKNYSYKEISSTLDIAIGTVMSRISRGRKILRTLLLDYAKEVRLYH